MKKIHLPLLVVVSMLLASCSMMSLADDIIPPPGSQQGASVETNPPPTSSGPLYPLVAPNPSAGAAIYAEKCAPCHGEIGKGDGPQSAQLPNPTTAIGTVSVARLSTPAEWYAVVTRGNMDRFMPPFHSLSDRQRWDVIAYVYSLSTSPAAVSRGQEIYLENCADCHGSSGRGDGPQAAALTASMPDFTDQAYMARKSTQDFYRAIAQGPHPQMTGFSGVLSEDAMWSVTDYLRTLSFTPNGLQASAPAAPSAAETEQPSTQTAEETAEPEEEQPTGFGVVTGKVINGSSSEALEPLTVTLHGFDGMQVVITTTVTTDDAGLFRFEQVEMPAGRIYLTTAQLNDATYASQFVPVEEGMKEISLEVTVYETTTDLTHLVTDRMHIFLDFSVPDTVQVIELYIMSNLGKKTIVSAEADGPVAVFSLPQGATNLQFQDGALGERYKEVPGGFADTLSLPPTTGEYQVMFGYELPYDRKLDLRRSFSTAVESVVLLQESSSVKLKSDQLKDSGPRDMQGISYQMYMGGPFDVGSELVLNISGRPDSAPTLAESSSQSLVLGLGAFGVVMIAAGVWLYSRSKTNGLEEIDEDEEEQPEEELDRDSLVDAIVALDDLYQSGELPEEAYRQRRAELKDQLKKFSDG
jgi:mono/diheme cytochrome c family protein